jgi:hypothetical protein
MFSEACFQNVGVRRSKFVVRTRRTSPSRDFEKVVVVGSYVTREIVRECSSFVIGVCVSRSYFYHASKPALENDGVKAILSVFNFWGRVTYCEFPLTN